MDTDRKWIVVRIDGKLAGISTDYGRLADISARIAKECRPSDKTALPYREITANAVTFEEVLQMKQTTTWEEMVLFGTDFQKRVWKRLWDMSTSGARLLSYSDFAELCDNKAGVRAVAHAIGLNPLPVVIPCHLIVPKEAIDRIREIQHKAESTIFRGEDLCHTAILNDNDIDFGEYALGKDLKRNLISMEMAEK